MCGGTEMKQGEWQDGNLRTLGIWFGKRNDLRGAPAAAGECRRRRRRHFLLPAAPADEPWIRQFDTALDSARGDEPRRTRANIAWMPAAPLCWSADIVDTT